MINNIIDIFTIKNTKGKEDLDTGKYDAELAFFGLVMGRK